MINLINILCYYPLIWLTIISLAVICISKSGGRIFWNPNEMKPMKLFSWFAVLFCTGTGVGLLGVAPDHIREYTEQGIGAFTPYACWSFLYWDLFAVFAIFYAKYYKTKFCKILVNISLICGLCASILFASVRFLRFFGMEGNGIVLILPLMILISILAFISVKKRFLVRYSRINIYMFLILTIMVSGTSNILGFSNPFSGITKIFSYVSTTGNKGWLTDQEFLSYIAFTLSWTPFVARFLIHVSNGRTIRQFVFGVITIPSIATIIWIAVALNAKFEVNSEMKLTFIGILFLLTMIMFLVTTLDSTGKLVVKDFTENEPKELKEKATNVILPIYYIITLFVAMVLLYFENVSQIVCGITYYMVIPCWIVCIYTILYSFKKSLHKNSGIISKDEWKIITEKCNF